jgi:4-azaleucine resistance transporter AzlC
MSRQSRWQTLRAGAAAAWPICLGYIPIGFALGVMAKQAGFSPLDIGLMSLLVFAGSAQFIAVAMIAAGTTPTALILTTFIVNLRHFLMSSALAVHLRGRSRKFLALFAYGITDESFAINMSRFRKDWSPGQALALNQIANAVWILSTIIGALAGSLIPAGAFGVDFALPAMFIALLVMQLQTRIHVITALIAITVSVLWSLFIPGDGYAVAAATVAATGGYLLQRRRDPGRRTP